MISSSFHMQYNLYIYNCNGWLLATPHVLKGPKQNRNLEHGSSQLFQFADIA